MSRSYFRHLRLDAQKIIDVQRWDDDKVNALLDDFIGPKIEPFEEMFRQRCAVIAAQKAGGDGLAFVDTPLPEIVEAVGWDDDTMRTLKIAFYRGVATHTEFDGALADFLLNQVSKENDAAARFGA